MIICIFGNPEPEPFGKACQRAVDFGGPHAVVDIHCPDRTSGGWLEYQMSFKDGNGNQNYLLAMIQRGLGQAYEFHS